MTPPEAAVLDVLHAEAEHFAHALARWESGLLAPGEIRGVDPPEPIGLDLDRISARSGLHRRATRRALERLAAAGAVTRREGVSGVLYRFV